MIIITTNDVIDTVMECTEFSHQVEYEIDSIEPIDDIHLEWRIDDTLPNNLIINSDTGLISGKILTLRKQNIPNHLRYPDEPLEADGSNHMNDGGIVDSSYSFDFDITKVTLLERIMNDTPIIVDDYPRYEDCILDDNIIECIKDGKVYDKIFTTKALSIVVTKDGDLSNSMFMKRYLENDEIRIVDKLVLNFGTMTIEPIEVRRYMLVGEQKYYIEDIEEFLTVHPGPFKICEEK